MRLSQPDRAWLAGFFDGDGCILSKKTGNGYLQVRASYSQKDKKVLENLQVLLGYGRIWSKRTAYSLEITRQDDVEEFIRLIYPYSRVKRSQLKVAYALLQTRGLVTPRKWSLHCKLSRLKQVPPVTPRKEYANVS